LIEPGLFITGLAQDEVVKNLVLSDTSDGCAARVGRKKKEREGNGFGAMAPHPT